MDYSLLKHESGRDSYNEFPNKVAVFSHFQRTVLRHRWASYPRWAGQSHRHHTATQRLVLIQQNRGPKCSDSGDNTKECCSLLLEESGYLTQFNGLFNWASTLRWAQACVMISSCLVSSSRCLIASPIHQSVNGYVR